MRWEIFWTTHYIDIPAEHVIDWVVLSVTDRDSLSRSENIPSTGVFVLFPSLFDPKIVLIHPKFFTIIIIYNYCNKNNFWLRNTTSGTDCNLVSQLVINWHCSHILINWEFFINKLIAIWNKESPNLGIYHWLPSRYVLLPHSLCYQPEVQDSIYLGCEREVWCFLEDWYQSSAV